MASARIGTRGNSSVCEIEGLSLIDKRKILLFLWQEDALIEN